jgi:hypothetical protein
VSLRCALANQGIPLSGGFGFLLPEQRADEVILYGPGAYGFQMSRWSSGRHAPGLIPYMQPRPLVSRKDLQSIKLILREGDVMSDVTLYGELVVEPKLLGVPATAGSNHNIPCESLCV